MYSLDFTQLTGLGTILSNRNKAIFLQVIHDCTTKPDAPLHLNLTTLVNEITGNADLALNCVRYLFELEKEGMVQIVTTPQIAFFIVTPKGKIILNHLFNICVDLFNEESLKRAKSAK